MEIPKDFFTLASFTTFSGLVGATWVVTNGIAQAFDFKQKWVGLIVAIILVEIGTSQTAAPQPVDYFIGFVNSFLIYLAAGGAANAANAGLRKIEQNEIRPQNAGADSRNSAANSKFLAKWF